MTDTVISEARAAWGRLKSRKNFEDWLAVGAALLVGQTHAMKLAKTNKPHGRTYNVAVSAWLRENGLDEISTQERYKIIKVVENRAAIEAWRNGLDDAKRRRFNHPNAVWYAWKRATAAERQKVPSAYEKAMTQRVTEAIEARKGRPIYWSQSSLRRAHEAMLESRSSDLLTLARAALEAAIRTEADLLAILNETPPTHARATSPKREPAQASPHA